MTAVENAFRWVRIQAVRHMAAHERTGMEWSAPTITEIMTAHTSRAVTVVPFTQRAEALIGVDWVWWADGADAYRMRSPRCGFGARRGASEVGAVGSDGKMRQQMGFHSLPTCTDCCWPTGAYSMAEVTRRMRHKNSTTTLDIYAYLVDG